MASIAEVVGAACTGCGGCEVICPMHCIVMKPDQEGFLAPVIDAGSCLDCSKCLNICPAYNDREANGNKRSLLFRSLQPESASSSSGGAAYALGLFAVNSGRAVIACAFGAGGVARHILVTSAEELGATQGSKYVQSDARDGYRQLVRALGDGRRVLFIGTPCQVAAAKRIAGGNSLLLTCDLICHGTPSPQFWQKDLDWQNGRGFLLDREDVQFRNHSKRSRVCYELYCRQYSSKQIPYERDPYFTLFMENASLRESCYACRFACEVRVGDITIGDSASRDFYPDFHPCEPVSTLCSNTEMGDAFMRDMIGSQDCDYIEMDYERETRLNGQLHEPSRRPQKRDVVYRDLEDLDYRDFAMKYCKPITVRWKLGRLARTLVPIKARAVLKKKARGLKRHGRQE